MSGTQAERTTAGGADDSGRRRAAAWRWLVASWILLAAVVGEWNGRWRPVDSNGRLLQGILWALIVPTFVAINVPAWIHLLLWSRSDGARRATPLRLLLVALPLVVVFAYGTYEQFDYHSYVPDGRGSDVRVYGPPLRVDVEEWAPFVGGTLPALLGALFVWRAARRTGAVAPT